MQSVQNKDSIDFMALLKPTYGAMFWSYCPLYIGNIAI